MQKRIEVLFFRRGNQNDHPGNLAAIEVLTALYGKAPYITRMGGTIPVSGMLLKILGIQMIGFAFGLNDESIHAPNEFFRLKSFQNRQKAYGMMLEALGRREFNIGG